MRSLAAVLVCLFIAVASPASGRAAAADGCVALSDIDVDVAADRPVSGQAFELAWTADARCSVPRYLIIALSERVRFSGDGAIALAPGERAPHDIGYRRDAMRLAIPLHGEHGRDAVSVVPYVTGPLTIDWALASPREGGEILVEGDPIAIEIAAGLPKIVVQDLYATEHPIETVESASGDYRLDIFDGYFRVTDNLTGAPVITAEGFLPGFSPTSRFLHAFGEKGTQFRVFDLYSETLVLDLDREGAGGRGFFVQGVEWSPGDSFMMIAYEAGAAVGFKEMLFDRPYRYQADGCGGCPPTETFLGIDLEAATVAMGWALDGGFEASGLDGFSLLADRRTGVRPDIFSGQSASLEDRSGTRRPSDGGPAWFLNGARTASIDHEAGVPIFMRDGAVEATAVAGLVGDWESLRRGGASLGRAELANRDTRIAERLADFGIELGQTAAPFHEELTFLHALEEMDSWDAEEQQRHDDLYRVEPGQAALARRIVSRETAEAIDAAVARLTRDHATCGLESSHRALDGKADLWSWKRGGRLHQVIHYHCYVSTASIPAGIAFLVTAEGGRAEYMLLAETLDGEMELIDSYDLEPWVPDDKAASLVSLHMYGALRVYRPREDLVALLNSQGSLVVYDIDGSRTLLTVEEAPEFANVVNVASTRNGQHIVQINNDGRFFVYDTAIGGQVLSGRYLDDEVVVHDDTLRFDSTPEGAAHIHLKFPGDRSLYRLDQFESTLRVPGMAFDRLAGITDASPPSVVTAPPTVRLELSAANAGKAMLRIAANSEAGLAEIVLYRDGRQIETIPAQGDRLVIEREVEVEPAERWLTAVGRDILGVRSLATSVATEPSTEAPAERRLFAIAVGTDTYDDPRIRRLSYAASDARTFLDSLNLSASTYYSTVQSELLVDAPDLASALPETIARVAALMRPADTLFLHVAGHGVLGADGVLYLADRATQLDDMQGTSLAWSQLSDALSAVPGRVFLFLDACHSGAAGMASNDDAAEVLLTAPDTRINVVAASKGRQFSIEAPRFGGGVFTSTLATILSDVAGHDADSNGVLEFSELYRALKRRVVTVTDGEQIPWVSQSGLVGNAPVL